MHPRLPVSDPIKLPAWALSTAALWIVGFLAFYFLQPLGVPNAQRTDLWMMMADEILGVSDPPSSADLDKTPSGLQFLRQRAPLIGWAAAILALAAAHGFAACELLLPRVHLLKSERLVCILGIGLAVLSLATLCCGLFGQLNSLAVASPSAVSLLVAGCCRRSRREVVLIRNQQQWPTRSSKLLAGLVLLTLVPFAAYLLLGSVSPPTDFDVREYHLQGPKEWFQQGQISFLRHNVYTSFPFLSEMLCLTGMVITGDWWLGALTGQIVLSCFQLLSMLAVFAIAQRWLNSNVAWLAALIYLTTPWTLRISLIAYAEGSLTFYLISSTMVALWTHTPAKSVRSVYILSGILAGCAMASKYTGLVLVILPVSGLLLLGLRRGAGITSSSVDLVDLSRRKQFFICFGSYAFGIALMITPWLLRNLSDTGNPVYPLGYSIFGGEEWSAELNARWKTAHSASEHQWYRIPQHFLDAAVFNTWTSGLLFSLAVPTLLLCRRSRAIRSIWILIAWGMFTWWAFTHRIDRFWIPVIPLLSIAGACCWLFSESMPWKLFTGFVISAVTLFNVRFCSLAVVGFHAGLMDLDAAREMTVRSDILMLNQSLPPNAKVLMVGEAEVFDATFPLLYNTVFDDSIFEEWTSDPADVHSAPEHRRMRPASEIRNVFKKHEVTHVLVHWGEILRYRLPGSYEYASFVQPSRFDLLVEQNFLTAPRTLLTRPWASMSDAEKATIQKWEGYHSLISTDETLALVQLYKVVDQQ
jgi:hypothetical protein